MKDPGAGGSWFGGAGNFVAGNPNENAKIIYYMGKRHTFGKMFVEIYDPKGNFIKTLPAGKSAGINMVEMPTNMPSAKSAPTNNRIALFGSLLGPNLPAGVYKAKVVKGKTILRNYF